MFMLFILKTRINIKQPAIIFFQPILNSILKLQNPSLFIINKVVITVSATREAIVAPTAPNEGISDKFNIRFITDPDIRNFDILFRFPTGV